MHFVGIKCEVCSELANTSDPIDNLPPRWIAIVQYVSFKLFTNARKEALHFCSMKCLCAWTREQEQTAPTQANDTEACGTEKREALALELIARKFDYIERALMRLEKQT
jgi:hypothetical protein